MTIDGMTTKVAVLQKLRMIRSSGRRMARRRLLSICTAKSKRPLTTAKTRMPGAALRVRLSADPSVAFPAVCSS